MGLVFGEAEVTLNGTLLPTKKGVTAGGFGDLRRAIVEGYVHGYAKEATIKWCECPVTDSSDINMMALHNTENGTLVIRSGGKSYTLRNCWEVGDATLESGEGKHALRFEGLSWEERTE